MFDWQDLANGTYHKSLNSILLFVLFMFNKQNSAKSRGGQTENMCNPRLGEQ